jgi:branched-chain amino acid transport system substrate-binding protein
MKMKRGKTWVVFCFAIFFAISFIGSEEVLSSTTEYKVSATYDFTGPFAVTMPSYAFTSKVLIPWWNETKGKEIGITLKEQSYDHRYDATVVASLWPGIVSTDRPIAHKGQGAVDVMALMRRLPDDKVPMIMGTCGYGFVWNPNLWVFFPGRHMRMRRRGFSTGSV